MLHSPATPSRRHDPIRLSSKVRADARGQLGSHDLAALRQQLESCLGITHEGVYGVDRTGCTTLVTPSVMTMTGHAESELVGSAVHDVLHHSHANGDRYPRDTCPIYAACRDGQIESNEAVFWRKNGSNFPIEYTTTPLVQCGEVVGAVVIFRELDPVRQLRREVTRLIDRLALFDTAAEDLNPCADDADPSCEGLPPERAVSGPLGISASWRQVIHLVGRVAFADSTVLVTGESGTGKELVAREIHQRSRRLGAPLVKVNCAALPT